MTDINQTNFGDKCKNLSALVELNWEDECGRAICFDPDKS